jgi:hypothetical protein
LSYWNVAYPNLNSQFDRAGFEARRNNYMRVDTSGAVSGKSSYSLVEAPPSLLILSVSPEPGQKQDIGPAEHPFPFKTYSHSQDYDNSQPNSALYMGLSPEESGGSDVSMDQQHGTSFTFDSPLVEDTPSRVSLHRRSPTPRIFMGVHPAQNDDLQHTLSLPAFSSASASPASSAAVSALSQQAKRSSQRSVKSLQTRAVKPARLMTLPVVQASARVVRICAYVPVSQLAALLAIWQFSFMEVLETLPGFESCTFSLLGEEAPVYLDSHWSSAVDAKTVCTSSHFTDAVNLLRDIEDANIFVELLQSEQARAPVTAATDSKNSTSSRSSNTLARTKSTSNVSYAGASPKNFTRSLRAFDNH